MQNLGNSVDSWRSAKGRTMHRYHYLDCENLNKHPKTLAAFHRWLSQAFKAVQRWLEQGEFDESDLEFATAVVRRVSQTARRLGAGHLAEPVHHTQHLHADALALLGKMLVWVEGQRPSGAWSTQDIAKWMKVSPDKVLTWIRNGELKAYSVADGAADKPKYRVDPAEVDAFLLRRSAQPASPLGRRRNRRRAAV
jgi:excisionase family DNA binding protein